MGIQPKLPSVLLVGTVGLAVTIATSLLLASPSSETTVQPLDIAALQSSANGSSTIIDNGHPSRPDLRANLVQPVAFVSPTSGPLIPLYGHRNGQDSADYPTSYETFDLDADRDEEAWVEDDHDVWNNHTLAQDERLSTLWEREWKLPLATLYRLLSDDENATILNRVRSGQEIEWQVDDEGYLTHLRLWTNRADGYEWVREEGGWDFSRAEIENGREIQHMVIHGEIEGNIASALAQRTDLSPRAVNALSVLLDRYLPVRTRARSGDEFTLLLEIETLMGDDTPYNLRLLAFDYQGQQIAVRAARNTNGRFYTPDGKSLLPPFDRRPFSGNYRISSSFNPRRQHPVTGRIAPHHGTDFAMPTGTPIHAPADGRVTRVENHPHAGRFIVIEHGQGYSTRYLHLQRPLVQVGQQVARGDRIALSGNTGRSTGPHLHYEVHVNHQPRDPMRVELPESEALAGEELERFQAIGDVLLAQMDETERNRMVAFTPYDEMAR